MIHVFPRAKKKATLSYTVPVQEILEKYDAPSIMDYLLLDIEGAEFLVVKKFPFTSYKFRTMTVERPSQDIVDLSFENGYTYIGGTNKYGEDTAWAHR